MIAEPPPPICYQVPAEPPAADWNQDGGVDGADVEAFYSSWSDGESNADVNLDGVCDACDWVIWWEQFEQGEVG